MTGELLEFKPEKNELFSLVEKFMDNYIILPSPTMKMYAKRVGRVYLSPYFLTMPANELSELLDASFDTFSDIDNEYYRC